MKHTYKQRVAIYQAAADGYLPALKAAIKQLDDEEDGDKMEMEDEDGSKQVDSLLVEELRPLAESVAAVAGGTPEEALAVMMAYVAERAVEQVVEEEPAVQEMIDEEPVLEPAVMSHNNTANIAASMAKSFATLATARSGKSAGYPVIEAPQIMKRAEQQDGSLMRLLRALARHDHQYLSRHQSRAVKSYKAMAINPDTAGGYLVPPEQSSEIIEVLRAQAKVLPLCRTLPMNRDTLDIPAQTAASTTYFVGENATITDSEPTFGSKKLVARKQATLVKIPSELLDDADPDVEAYVRNDIAREMANKVDEIILRGTGVGNEPLGLLNNGDITSTAISGSSDMYVELVNVVERIETANVNDNDIWTWVLHPKAKAILRQMQDGASQYIWTGSDGIGQQAGGTLSTSILDHPWVSTTLGGLDSNSRSRIFFGNWNDIVVGMRKSIEFMVSAEAGEAFENDQVWIRAIMRWDVVPRHTESIEILTAVQ